MPAQFRSAPFSIEVKPLKVHVSGRNRPCEEIPAMGIQQPYKTSHKSCYGRIYLNDVRGGARVEPAGKRVYKNSNRYEGSAPKV